MTIFFPGNWFNRGWSQRRLWQECVSVRVCVFAIYKTLVIEMMPFCFLRTVFFYVWSFLSCLSLVMWRAAALSDFTVSLLQRMNRIKLCCFYEEDGSCCVEFVLLCILIPIILLRLFCVLSYLSTADFQCF